MNIAMFKARPYDRETFEATNQGRHEILYIDANLRPETVPLAAGHPCICLFVNDAVDARMMESLSAYGVRLLALRSAGTNHVDVAAADRLGMTVIRVPAYSPHAIAEHAMALLLTLNRKTHRAFNRVREGNFALDGLMGFDLYGKTVGLIGVGHIGRCMCDILKGFGCRVLVHDPYAEAPPGTEAVDLDKLLAGSDVVSLHCPLTPKTRHLIDDKALEQMKPGVILINTGRGGLVDTHAVIRHLKTRHIGGLALDVYEEEAGLFFDDHSSEILQDDLFARLTTFSNVLITGHQGFFTCEALRNIAETTLGGVDEFESEQPCTNRVFP